MISSLNDMLILKIRMPAAGADNGGEPERHYTMRAILQPHQAFTNNMGNTYGGYAPPGTRREYLLLQMPNWNIINLATPHSAFAANVYVYREHGWHRR